MHTSWKIYFDKIQPHSQNDFTSYGKINIITNTKD